MKNHFWEQEEVILLVDLYFELQKQEASKEETISRIKELSDFLRRRATILKYDISESFRNSIGITMKMANIQYVVSDGEKGLSSVSATDRDMVNKYLKQPEYMHSQALLIKQKYEEDCPLVLEFKKLKKSSSEAVDNEEAFSEFKKYMHIHRSLEDELIEKINQAKSRNGKSLILVCGNVGDGKSHIISYLKNTQCSLLDGFVIHNDATESRSRDRDEKEELARVLNDFKDCNLNNYSDNKTIVAINLGVLSNFIDSEQGKEFIKLAEYVNKNKILVDTDISNYSDENNYFSYVNFGDYHIYRLTDGNADSPYIAEVIDRIFGKSLDNPFYRKYQDCSRCPVNDCPVKHNFELMQQEDIANGIINILIETIVKDKIILSTRELLDFFYDIIVHPEFDKKKYLKCKNRLSKYIKYSMPSIIFEHDEISPLLAHIKRYDFVTQRTKIFDDITTRFSTTDSIDELFRENISDNSAVKYILSNPKVKEKEYRKELLYYFTRLCKLSPRNADILTVNHEFEDFIRDLFYYVKGKNMELKSLYTTVQRCVYAWNGGSNNRINLKNDVEGYIVSTELNLVIDKNSFRQESKETSFDKFPAYINITLMDKKHPESKSTISIDYDLYKMLKLVENGYRPSARDNNRFIGFLTFINHLSEFSANSEEVVIECLKHDNRKKYKFIKDNVFGGYSFEEVE